VFFILGPAVRVMIFPSTHPSSKRWQRGQTITQPLSRLSKSPIASIVTLAGRVKALPDCLTQTRHQTADTDASMSCKSTRCHVTATKHVSSPIIKETDKNFVSAE
jgi:hypothetical protein